MYKTDNTECNKALALIDTIEAAVKELKTLTHNQVTLDTMGISSAVAKLAGDLEKSACKES